jgi:hypothetical protein
MLAVVYAWPPRRRRVQHSSRWLSAKTTTHPAPIPQEVAGSSRPTGQSPQRQCRKTLLTAGIPAHPRLDRKRQDRPVTPEVAGSSPVAPVENTLQIGIFVAESGVIDRRLPNRSRAHPARDFRTRFRDVKRCKSPCSASGPVTRVFAHPAQIPQADHPAPMNGRFIRNGHC